MLAYASWKVTKISHALKTGLLTLRT